LPIDQSAVAMNGHAVQARLYAEDPALDFLPSTGTIRAFVPPSENVRLETGVVTGSEITPHYDSLLAKIIVHADDRRSAFAQLRRALMETTVLGVDTNLGLLAALSNDQRVIADDVDNLFIDRELPAMRLGQAPAPAVIAIAGAIAFQKALADPDGGAWRSALFTSWRASDDTGQAGTDWLGATLLEVRGDKYRLHRHAIEPGKFAITVDDARFVVDLTEVGPGHFTAAIDGRMITCRAWLGAGIVYLATSSGAHKFVIKDLLAGSLSGTASDGRVMSDMMGLVIRVNVGPGDAVTAGDAIVLQESMKMELTIAAPCDGTVIAVHCQEGDMIERNVLVVEIEPMQKEEAK